MAIIDLFAWDGDEERLINPDHIVQVAIESVEPFDDNKPSFNLVLYLTAGSPVLLREEMGIEHVDKAMASFSKALSEHTRRSKEKESDILANSLSYQFSLEGEFEMLRETLSSAGSIPG